MSKEITNKMKNKTQFIPMSKEMPEKLTLANSFSLYPIFIKSEKFEKLLVVQSKPVERYWFQNKEVTMDELIEILSNVAL
jgi:hypothetical protein